jgi:hypothetical protein
MSPRHCTQERVERGKKKIKERHDRKSPFNAELRLMRRENENGLEKKIENFISRSMRFFLYNESVRNR